MKKKRLLSGLMMCALFSWSSPLWASVESYSGLGFGQTLRSDFANSPSVINYSEDAYAVIGIPGLLKVGAGGAFRFVRQLSSVDASSGSLDGNRWELYPVVSFPFLGFAFAPIIEIGRYNLNHVTASGSSLAYKAPLGFRVFFSPLALPIAFFADYTIYGKVNDSFAGDESLTDNHLRVWSLGAAFHLSLM